MLGQRNDDLCLMVGLMIKDINTSLIDIKIFIDINLFFIMYLRLNLYMEIFLRNGS